MLLQFYQRIRDQYINQTPMGTEKGAPMHLTPRLEGYRAALELYEYPRWLWEWLIEWGIAIHGMVHGMAPVTEMDWMLEFGRPRRLVGFGELM